MATVNYRDPGTGLWAVLPTPAGPQGPQGPAGAVGPTAVSKDPGNSAVIGSDGGIHVTSVPQSETDLLYVNVSGDTMTGALLLPDQVFTPPTVPTAAAAKGYVDQLITTSADDPSGIPARDGLLWTVIGEEEPGYDSFVTSYDDALYDATS